MTVALEDNSNSNRYRKLINLFKRAKLNPLQLSMIKELIEDMIDSVRRLECLTTMADIIDCLEREDFITDSNIKILYSILKLINSGENEKDNGDLLKALKDYDLLQTAESKYTPEEAINLYKLQRFNNNNSILKKNYKNEVNYSKKKSAPEQKSKNATKNKEDWIDSAAVYKLIANNIGQKYRNFARELHIDENILEELIMKYPCDLQSRIYSIFEIFERNTPTLTVNERMKQICCALEGCRRKDLCRKITLIRNG